MNKRTFIKLSSAMMASPIISPLLAAMPDDKLKNWSGNLEYGTERLYSAKSRGTGAGICGEAEQAEGARHAALLQHHCEQHRPISCRCGRDGENGRSGRGGAYGDDRSRHELRSAWLPIWRARALRCTTWLRFRTFRLRGRAAQRRMDRGTRTGIWRRRCRRWSS